MLLVEITLNGVINRVSLDGWALTHNWRPRIIDPGRATYSIPSDHGGHAKMTFGSISFMPLLFKDYWLPPVSCPIAFYYSDITEEEKVELFRGTAYLYSFDRVGMTYSLYGPTHNEIVGDQTVLDGDLNSVITSLLEAIPEITSVDTSKARTPSPAVSYTVSGSNVLALNLASEIAQFYSHLFYIEGMVAYLIDMKVDNGTRSLIPEGKYAAYPKYTHKSPISVLKSGDFSVSSAYPYGAESSVTAYHTDQGVIEAALTDILAIENAQRVSLDMPMEIGNFPVHGEKVSLFDSANVNDISLNFRVRKIQYDFLGLKINIEGEVV